MNLGEYRDDPNERRSMVRSVSTGGGYSGTGYDQSVRARAAASGPGSTDTPLNKLQYKYWVTKSKVVRKLGKEEDECITLSDAQLDAKLELYKSIHSSTQDLSRILDQYNDRLCNLAYEENCMGRFLKDFGKLDKTKAGKIMIASGKAMSYSSQQRLALRPSILRLAEEVDTFRYRAIEDTSDTVTSMEKVRTEYRGALMWMKNVSTELDPDTYKQLEKFRKVQGHVKFSKQRFDRLKVDCVQKIDLLAAARCNMYSHALVMYQDALINFCEKVATTFTHVEQSFEGYQPYEFQYIKELTDPTGMFADLGKKGGKRNKNKSKEIVKDNSSEPEAKKEEVKDEKFFFDLDDKSEEGIDALTMAEHMDQSEASLNNLLELEDKDDELLLQLEENKAIQQAQKAPSSKEVNLFGDLNEASDSKLLDDLLTLESSPTKIPSAEDSPERFSAQWNKLFGQEPKNIDDSTVPDLRLDTLGQDNDEFGSFFSSKNVDEKLTLPSQLFELDQNLLTLQTTPLQGQLDLTGLPYASPARPSTVQKEIDLLQQKEEESKTESQTAQTNGAGGSKKLAGNSKSKDNSQWFSLFADLDPLANPDAIGKTTKESDPNCYS